MGRKKILFVQTRVNLHLEENLVLTISQRFAALAGVSTLRTSTKKPNTVQYAKVKSVTLEGIEPVYNLEVPKTHNFSINGGLIVHNCMDECRYFGYTILEKLVNHNKYKSLWM